MTVDFTGAAMHENPAIARPAGDAAQRTVKLGVAAAALLAALNLGLAVTLFVVAGVAGGKNTVPCIIVGVPVLIMGAVGLVGVRLMQQGKRRGANVAAKGTWLLFLTPLAFAMGAFEDGFHPLWLILAAVVLAVLVGATILVDRASHQLPAA
ncbi:hypothetical protein GCM10010532_052260 [Dactylosporangium siamense]|uniref:Uncharacterized protein n=2 Tax=Dactylosporangium siamense TaxID=685454 RepID=A0A919PKG4_9ACTN|nr:hypothetical protein Dsi01nite_034350 [Dactylosporangium siamense]